VAAALAAASGCKSKEAPLSRNGDTSAPADHLAKGEIPEGRERAFSLPLPLRSQVKIRFRDNVQVVSSHTHEELSNFVRARVKSGRVLIGTTMTTFEDVVVPSEPTRHLKIEIRQLTTLDEHRSEMIVRDITPPPSDPNETDADRWRKVGLTPDGRLIDPGHMQ
jgi:hypothetical protein